MQVITSPSRTQALTFQNGLETFLLSGASRNLSKATLDWYGYCLKPFESFLQKAGKADALPQVTQRDIQEFLRERIQYQKERGRSDVTVKKVYEALRAFFRFLYHEGMLFVNPIANVGAPRVSQKVLRPLTEDEVTALLAAPNKKTFCSFRDYVLLMLFLDTGLRLNEALGLRLCDVNLQEGTLLVMGKGRKERKVPFGQIQDYLKRYARHAGIQKPVHPHLLRHTFALNFILQGGNPFILQEILGHTTLEMTRRYVSLANQSFTGNRVSFMDKLAESGQAALPRRKMF